MAEYIERDAALRVAHTMRPEDKRLKITMANIPATDVAPVVHGRWEDADWVELVDSGAEIVLTPKAALRCSRCKFALKKESLWRRKYCPNCGARMDGEA